MTNHTNTAPLSYYEARLAAAAKADTVSYWKAVDALLAAERRGAR